MAKNPKDSYSASDITVYTDDHDKIRNTPGVYIADMGDAGIKQLFDEILDNAIDEHKAGHGNIITVAISGNNVIIKDEGRGVPVEKHPKTKKSTLTTVFSMLNAGGKGKTTGAYKKSTIGVHGMGAAVVNALSEKFDVYSYRNGWYNQTFKKGVVVQKEPEKISKPKVKIKLKNCGTIVSYSHDVSMFDKGAKLDLKAVKEKLTLTAYMNPKLVINYYDNGELTTIKHPKGLVSLLDSMIEEIEVEKNGKLFQYESDGLHVLLQWSSHSDEYLQSFVNSSRTIEHGSHVNGLSKAISEAIRSANSSTKKKKTSAAKKKSGTKTPEEFRVEDLRSGLIGIINVDVTKPRFAGQVKNKLTTQEVTDDVYKAIVPELLKFFDKNKTLARSIVKRAIELRKLTQRHSADKKALASLKDKQKKGKIYLPAKLSVSEDCKPKDRELFIIEGDSAGGTAKLARDKAYQETLPLRGKILNVYKDSSGKLFLNTEIQSLIHSIGYDPSNKKNPLHKLRVGKIIILTDADVDGHHISALNLAFYQKEMPEIVEAGMIYTVSDALYMYKNKDERFFGKDLKNIQEQLKSKKITFKQESLTRIKGWGEINPDDLKYVAFNPKTRMLNQVQPVSAKDAIEVGKLMGKDGDARKEILGIT